MNILALICGEYYYLRQTLPLFLYVFYIHFKEKNHPIIEALMKTGLVSIGLMTAYLLLGVTLKIPFMNMIPFKWSYPGPITWATLFFAYYYVLTRKNQSKLKAFTLAALVTVGGGWLYEVSFYHPLGMFFLHNSIFYVNGQIICLLLVGYELKKMDFRPNKFIYATLLLFLAFSTTLFMNKNALWRIYGSLFMRWMYRVPASLFLLSLLSGVKNG